MVACGHISPFNCTTSWLCVLPLKQDAPREAPQRDVIKPLVLPRDEREERAQREVVQITLKPPASDERFVSEDKTIAAISFVYMFLVPLKTPHSQKFKFRQYVSC